MFLGLVGDTLASCMADLGSHEEAFANAQLAFAEWLEDKV